MNALRRFTAVLGAAALAATFADEAVATGTTDPALVARYETNSNELSAKMAECKKKVDPLAVFNDVSCASAQEVLNRRERKMLDSKCRTSDTFVYVPSSVKGKDLESYLLSHAPSEEALRNCGQSKEQWLRSALARSGKK